MVSLLHCSSTHISYFIGIKCYVNSICKFNACATGNDMNHIFFFVPMKLVNFSSFKKFLLLRKILTIFPSLPLGLVLSQHLPHQI